MSRYREELQKLIDQGLVDDARKLLRENLSAFEKWEVLLVEAAIETRNPSTRHKGLTKLLIADRLPSRGWEIPYSIARVYMAMDNQLIARKYAQQAYKEAPDIQRVLLAYMHTLLDISDYKAVLQLFEKHKSKIKFNRQFTLAAVSALRASGKLEKARLLVEKLLLKLPDDKTGLRLLGDICADVDSIEGLEKYKEIIAQQTRKYGAPDIATCWNASLHFLRSRLFTEGWKYWEMGFGREVGTMARRVPEQLGMRGLSRVKQDDQLDPGRWVIVSPEQGIGDQVLFLSGLNEIAKTHERLILVADPRLYPMLKRSFRKLRVAYPGLADGIGSQLGLNIQGYLPYGSILPRCRPSIDAFPVSKEPYLTPHPHHRAGIREQLINKARQRKIIGISWSGGFWEVQKKTKGIKFLDWIEAMKACDAQFVSLQYGETSKEREQAREHKLKLLFIDNVDFKKDIERWSSTAAACDGIFSISTALVHFTGAMGVRTRILLPGKYGPWILGNEDQHHLVYPNTDIRRNQEGIKSADFVTRELKDFHESL